MGAVSWLAVVGLTLLSIIGWAMLGVLALLLLLIMLVLALPLDLRLRLDSDMQAPGWEDELTGSVRWRLHLRWGGKLFAGIWIGEFFRVVDSEVRVLGVRRRPWPKPAKRANAKPKRSRKRKKRRLDLEFLWAMVTEAARFLKRLVDEFGFRFRGELTYGFSDPSLTGWCEALRWATGLPIPVQVHPDFQRPALLGTVESEGRVYGYEIAAALLRALRNPVIRRRMAQRIRFRPLRYLLARGG